MGLGLIKWRVGVDQELRYLLGAAPPSQEFMNGTSFGGISASATTSTESAHDPTDVTHLALVSTKVGCHIMLTTVRF